MTSLVFLERDVSLRRRLVELLTTSMPDVTPLGQALDENHLLTLCRTGNWRVAVVSLLGASELSFQFLELFRLECPRVPVIVLSFTLDSGRITRLLRWGVCGIVASENVPEEIEPAIRAALQNQQYLSETVRQILDGG